MIIIFNLKFLYFLHTAQFLLLILFFTPIKYFQIYYFQLLFFLKELS